jgi:putative ABC transport system permease protein
MKHLFLKTFRDVKDYWTQFLGVFFMTLISITIYAGMAVVSHGLDVSVEQYVNESNLAAQWIYTTGIMEDEMNRFESDAGIQEVTYASRIRADVKGGHQFLELTALSNDIFMKSYLVEGEAFDPESGGLWLDSKFAQENSLKPGDAIIIEYEGFEKEFEIEGLVLNIEKMLFTGSNLLTIPDHKTFGYAFIGKESLNELAPLYPYTEMRLGNGQRLSDDKLESLLGDRFLFSETREDKDFLEEVAKESNQMMKMSILFSPALMAIFLFLSPLDAVPCNIKQNSCSPSMS